MMPRCRDEPDFMKEPPHGAEVTCSTFQKATSTFATEQVCTIQVFVGGVPRGASEEQIKQYSTKVGEVGHVMSWYAVRFIGHSAC